MYGHLFSSTGNRDIALVYSIISMLMAANWTMDKKFCCWDTKRFICFKPD